MLRVFGVAAAISLSAVVSAYSQDEGNQSGGVSMELPLISDADRQLILDGSWWDLNPPLLPEPGEIESLEESAGPVSTFAERDPIVDVIPEDHAAVLEIFLPEYIKQASRLLIDPQRLLGEIERDDVISLINVLESNYGIKVYVSIFAAGQEVPPEINAPTLARQIFKPSERSILLHAHYGQVPAFQIACDAEWMEKMGDKGRRALLAQVKESASIYTNAQDSLIEAVTAMVLYARPEMETLLGDQTGPGAAEPLNIPEVPVEFIEEEKEDKKGLLGYLAPYGELAQQNISLILGSVAFLVLVAVLFLWYRNLRPVRLMESEADRRLGAPNGAGASRAAGYGDKSDSEPDSIPRQQMRAHLRGLS